MCIRDSIWAVTNGKVLECSMGHYIVPMISTILGFLFFRERPGRLQWMGIIFAGIGVLILLMGYGAVPWASLNVALSAALFAFFRNAPRSEPLPVCSWSCCFPRRSCGVT